MERNFTVEEAVERYLKERKPDVSESTYRNHKYALRHFNDFCVGEGIERLNAIDGFHLADYRLERQGEVKPTTAYNNLSTVRTFIRWCEHRDLVSDGLADGMTVPNREGEVRDTKLDSEQAERIKQHLRTYDYASFRHTLFELLWETGVRTGTVRGIDLGDFHPESKYIEIHHRPESGTPLKNGRGAEREINLHTEVANIVGDYIETKREQVEDCHGREPLLTTGHGRAATSTIQRTVYRVTQPCVYSNKCPHGREIDSCEAANVNHASKCPSSVSPHPVRRGSITEWLNDGNPKRLLADRMDVSEGILDKHYDARTERDKRELRYERLDIDKS